MEQEYQSGESNKLLVPAAIVVAGVLIAFAVYSGGAKPTDKYNVSRNDVADIAPVSDKDHIIGSRNAEVVVVEYSDTECPFCKVFHGTMKEVVAQYNGKVAWVYRHLPIAQLHSRAAKEAEATECVAELGGNQAFWQYLDKIFETTGSNNTLDPAQLPKLAVEVGIDEVKFNSCLSSGKYAEAVANSVEEGYKAGARGTPYSIAISKNGEQATINGAEPYANVKAKIDSLLK